MLSTKPEFISLLGRRLFRSQSVALAETVDTVTTEETSTTEENVNVRIKKSGLLAQHRNMLHEKRPYKSPASWIHQTEKYQRKIFGRYGSQSGVDPRICFPNATVAESRAVYLKLSEPKSLQDMIAAVNLQDQEAALKIQKREEDISKNMAKMEQWAKELTNRAQKKEADALAVKQKKERMMEEVRRHFGYKVDPRDERFKEALEQKEREEKKKVKAAKRLEKEQKLMAKLTSTAAK